MRRMFQLVTAFLILSSTSVSALDAAKAVAVTKAADSFAALAGDSARTGKVPRQTDPAAAPLLNLVFDTSEVQTGGVQPMAALGGLSGWLLAVNKVGIIYFLAGTGVTDPAAAAPDPSVAAKVDANSVAYAPELGRYSDAALRLEAAIMDTVIAYLATAPQSELDRTKNGIAQIRGGAAQTMNGLITALSINGMDDAWRRDRLAVLAEVAPRAAKFLLPEDLRALRENAMSVAAKMNDPSLRGAVTSLADALVRG